MLHAMCRLFFIFGNDDFWCNLSVIFTVQLPVLYAIQSKTNTFRLGWDLGWDGPTVGELSVGLLDCSYGTYVYHTSM